ncbi:MAG: hypothetical protein ACOYXT_07560 [Bacteroidota bacterium]
MSATKLRKQLIDKIRKTDNEILLQEVNRLLSIESEDIEIYRLNADQKKIIKEAEKQIKNGQFLTNEIANKEIDE